MLLLLLRHLDEAGAGRAELRCGVDWLTRSLLLLTLLGLVWDASWARSGFKKLFGKDLPIKDQEMR